MVYVNGVKFKNGKISILDNIDPYIICEVNNNINGNDVDYIKYSFESNNKKIKS